MITTNNHLTLLKGYRLTLNKIKCFGFTAYLKGCSSVRALKALVVIVDIPSHYDDPNELSDVILQSVVHSTPPSYSIDITAFDCVLVSLFSHCIPLVNTPQAGSLETKAASVFTIRGKITHTTHNGKKTLLSEVYKGSDAWTLGLHYASLPGNLEQKILVGRSIEFTGVFIGRVKSTDGSKTVLVFTPHSVEMENERWVYRHAQGYSSVYHTCKFNSSGLAISAHNTYEQLVATLPSTTPSLPLPSPTLPLGGTYAMHLPPASYDHRVIKNHVLASNDPLSLAPKSEERIGGVQRMSGPARRRGVSKASPYPKEGLEVKRGKRNRETVPLPKAKEGGRVATTVPFTMSLRKRATD